jgi:hypothetical protein
MRKFFFIHIPKTAGTSFREALERSISPDALFCDYGPASKKTSLSVHDCIYGKDGFKVDELTRQMEKFESSVLFGHIRAKKYIQNFGYEKMAVFLREPVARAVSEYLHHKRHADFRGSLVDFCATGAGSNHQAKILQGVDIAKFGFVGITEYYERSLANFALFSGVTVENIRLNVGSNYPDSFTLEELDCVRRANQLDMDLYHEALKVFEKQSGITVTVN